MLNKGPLPTIVWQNVLSFLTLEDILNAGVVNKYFQGLTHNRYLWKQLLKKYFPYIDKEAIERVENPEACFKEQYQQLAKVVMQKFVPKDNKLVWSREKLEDTTNNNLLDIAFVPSGTQNKAARLKCLKLLDLALLGKTNEIHKLNEPAFEGLVYTGTNISDVKDFFKAIAAANGRYPVGLLTIASHLRCMGVALKIAAANGYTKVVKDILISKISKEEMKKYFVMHRSNPFEIALQSAASNGHEKVVKLFLEHAWNEIGTDMKKSVHICAVKYGNVDVVNVLLEKADKEIIELMIFQAILYNKESIIRLIFKKCNDIVDKISISRIESLILELSKIVNEKKIQSLSQAKAEDLHETLINLSKIPGNGILQLLEQTLKEKQNPIQMETLSNSEKKRELEGEGNENNHNDKKRKKK